MELEEWLRDKYSNLGEKEKLEEIIIEEEYSDNYSTTQLSDKNSEITSWKKLDGKSLSLTEYPNLVRVVINGELLKSKITELHLGNLEKLVSLTVKNNKLDKIDVSKCSVLEEFDCSDNVLTDLVLGKSLKLTKLNASNNSLSNLEFLSNKGNKKILVELNLQNNNFSEDLYCCGSFPKLKILKIGDNNFSGELKLLEDLQDLKELDISRNDGIKGDWEYLPIDKLDKFEFERTGVYEEMCKIYELDIDDKDKVKREFDGIKKIFNKIRNPLRKEKGIEVTSVPSLPTLSDDVKNKNRLIEDDYYEIDKIEYDKTYPNNTFKDQVVEGSKKKSINFFPTKVIDIYEEKVEEKLKGYFEENINKRIEKLKVKIDKIKALAEYLLEEEVNSEDTERFIPRRILKKMDELKRESYEEEIKNDKSLKNEIEELESELEKKIIDLDRNDEFIRTTKEENIKLRDKEIYAILSYVWGAKISPNGLSRGGEKALAKADKACRLLGIRYLWMDQLCIDQSNPEEKNKEIPKMKKYYDNAAVTLIAIQTRIFKKNFEEEDEGPMKKGAILDLPKILRMVTNSEWFTRSWTFQEGWLSKHTLFMFDDYLIDGRALAETWVRCQSFAGSELGEDKRKVATPVGWTYKEGGHELTDTVDLELHQALRAIKNRKRSVGIDAIYSILGLLPYGHEVRPNYKEWGHEYKHEELEEALSEVMKVAVQNGYGEPLAWHGPSNEKLELCWMPEIKIKKDRSVEIKVEGGITVRRYKSETNKEDSIVRDSKVKMVGIKITGRKIDISTLNPDVAKIETGIQIDNGVHARSITAKLSNGRSSEKIILWGTKKTLEEMKENDSLIIPSQSEWKIPNPFAILVKQEGETYLRLGLVEFQTGRDLDKLESLASKQEFTIGKKGKAEYQAQIQVDPKGNN